MVLKFKRVENLSGPHPNGCAGIGIHALNSEQAMTIEEIIDEHRKYANQHNECVPSYGEIIRDLGIFICFGYVEIIEIDENYICSGCQRKEMHKKCPA